MQLNSSKIRNKCARVQLKIMKKKIETTDKDAQIIKLKICDLNERLTIEKINRSL